MEKHGVICLAISLLAFFIFTRRIAADKNVTTLQTTTLRDTMTVASTLQVSEIWNTTNDVSITSNYDGNTSFAQICKEYYTRASSQESSRKPGDKIPLYISAFYEGPNGAWDGSGIVPAAEMAFDDINARTDILPQYELLPIWNDTKCDAGTGSRALFDQLFRQPTKIVIFGPGCSTAAQAVASTAHYWNLITFSYSAESIALSNRKSYPYFYRSVSSTTAYNYARIRLLKKYGWKRVAIIHDNQEVHKLAADHIHDLMKAENITLLTTEGFFTDPRNNVENLKRIDAKIIITNLYEDTARKVFCEAYKQGITGEGYVWMLLGWYKHRFWEPVDADIDCTIEEMEQALHGSISTEIQMLNDPAVVTIANMTSTEYVRRLKARLKQPENLKYNYEAYGAPAYDGIWVIGLMLHRAAIQLAEGNNSKRLEDFTYNDSQMKELFFRLFADTHFEGVSGPVSFINGDRIGALQLEQMQIGCLEGWIRHANNCYVFIESPLTWTKAKAECDKIDRGLATLDEPGDVAFLKSKWPERSVSLFWIGLRRIQMQWMWNIDDVETDIWIPPGSSIPETSDTHCMAMNSDGTWQAMDCNTSLPYICKTHTEMALQIIGHHYVRTDQLRLIANFSWQNHEIPLDHTPEIVITYKQVQHGIPVYIYFTMCGLAFIGGILAFSFLIFNSKFRNQKYMKMSSPNLNSIIIAGSLLIYIWVAVSGIDNTLVSDRIFSLLCQIRMWLLSVGFVLSFGAMFSKTWRVYRVATFKKPRRVIITDQQLLILVAILFIIDVIILTLWQVISPWYISTEQGYETVSIRTQVGARMDRLAKQTSNDDPYVKNQKLLPYVDYCTCSWITYWFIALCGFKGLLLIFGMFLAWETRKVQISALNDSKLIGISVYNVVILCAVGGAISLIITDPSTLYMFTASIVLFCTTLTLCTIFVPKVVSVYKYPEGQSITTMKNASLSSVAESTSSLEITNLRRQVVQLEEALRKSKGEINTSDINIAIDVTTP